ncbi:hypothetical protein ASPFODRAFT_57397 [Aspergillus luchuensis CBS 106.47]|uniref:Uncharacterized protein n=1 Tax=Aspergillus luchuensis (strain CBS 106.47) TaxID=1137211 RepID=A0A1M3TWP7_ASPLC|nr:hypothetical protein ASPFODRAFT_57397 [Aspergillus luchuensis CBS 106.47]
MYCLVLRLSYTVSVGGQSLYVIQDVKLISEVHKQTKSLGNNQFLDILMAASGISGPTRARLWKEHIPRAITENALTPLAVSDQLRRSVSAPAEVSLFRWIMDVFTVTVSDGALGSVCLDKFPEVLDNMFVLQTNVYDIFTRRPKILAPKAYNACDNLLKILAKYFAMPREGKVGCAHFVTRTENEIRSAVAVFLAIRKECEEAFSRNSPTTSADIPVQLECCPTLKATVTETLRLHSGTHVLRHLPEDTEIGLYCLKKGSTVLIPL